MGGGGDGGAAAAQQAENQREARIQASIDAINKIFDGGSVKKGVNQVANPVAGGTYYDANGNTVHLDSPQYSSGATSRPATASTTDPLYSAIDSTTPMSRQKLYDEQKKAVTGLNRRDIDQQFKEAERQNRFGLARSGLMGGSADVDSNDDLERRTNKGIIQATAAGDAAAADLKTADERARQNLIAMAQSGVDTGTAQQSALRSLDATAQQAYGNRQGATVGRLFDDMTEAYLARQRALGMQNPTNYGQSYGIAPPTRTYSGSTQN